MKIVVIGGGPGGYVTAIRCAQYGGEVTVIEKNHLGGTCVNVGCIPTKALIKGVEPLIQWKSYTSVGIDGEKPSINLKKLQKHAKKAVTMSRQGIGFLLKKNNVNVIQGEAVSVKDKKVLVQSTEKELSVPFDKLILATGSVPSSIPSIVPDHERIIYSDKALEIAEIPARFVIIGAGVIGLEMATIYNQLGSKVTVLEWMDQVLPCEDKESTEALKKSLQKAGITILNGCKVESVKNDNGIVTVKWTQNSEQNSMDCETVLIATGRKPLINEPLFNSLQLDYSPKGIVTNEYMETNQPDVYAIGDVNGKWMLAHTASREGLIAAARIFGKEVEPINYEYQPSVIFTHPEYSAVGKRTASKTCIFPYSANGKARASGIREGFAKLFIEDNLLVGCTFFGDHSSDMISLATLIIQNKIPLPVAANTTFPHPTLSEVFSEAIELAEGIPLHL